MPDGTIIRNVPPGTTQRQLLERLVGPGQLKPTPQQIVPRTPSGLDAVRQFEDQRLQNLKDPSFGKSLVRGVASQFLGNVGRLPSLLGEAVLVAPFASGETLRRRAAEGQTLIPRVSGEQIMAAGDTIVDEAAQQVGAAEPRPVSQTFQRANRLEETATRQAAEANPSAFASGQILGDAATLATGRAPFAAARGRLPALATQAATTAGRRTIRQGLINVGRSAPVKLLARAAGRSVEAGAEGAILAALNDGDISESFGAAAGMQLAGSGALAIFPKTKKGLTGFAIAAAGLASAARLAQQFSPGENNSFEALDFAFEKLSLGLVAGFTAGLLGSGRISSRNASAPVAILADAITALPRGAAQSAMREMFVRRNDGNDSIGRVSMAIASQPDVFTEAQLTRLQKGFNDKKFGEAVDTMLADDDFQLRLAAAEARIEKDNETSIDSFLGFTR